MYSFVKNRKYAYIIAIALLVFSILSPFILPFHQGIDLTGGVQAKYSVDSGDIDSIIAQTKSDLINESRSILTDDQKKIITDAMVYKITGTNEFMVEVGVDESVISGDNAQKNAIANEAKEVFFSKLQTLYNEKTQAQISQSQYVNIGASVGQYIKNSGYLALTIVGIMISIYIMYAFSGAIPGMSSWPFAVVTAICLIHDVVVSFGLYVLASAFFPEFKIDIFLITAMLTVLGYSINDTIVIMDKIRATIKEQQKVKSKLETIVDNAIHATMRRSLFTSLTLLIVLVAMFFFGPEAIKGFTLAMIFGAIVGTWSSIFVAAPALVDLSDYDPNRPIKKKEIDPDGIYL